MRSPGPQLAGIPAEVLRAEDTLRRDGREGFEFRTGADEAHFTVEAGPISNTYSLLATRRQRMPESVRFTLIPTTKIITHTIRIRAAFFIKCQLNLPQTLPV